jgi:hypothetical protein
MEILVSVLLISIVILGIAKIREQNIAMSHYIASRMKNELSNTLFLKKEFLRYDRSEKNAYDLLRGMGIDKLETREILRKQKRSLDISDPLPLGENPLPVELRAFHLKGSYSSTYYRIFF